MPDSELADLVNGALGELGVDLGAWLRAWARVVPMLVIVPAFGGSALPAPARVGLGLALGLAIAPALRPADASAGPLALELAREFGQGLPVAIGAALLVHTALMAGGVIDELRGGRESTQLPVFPGSISPLGGLLGLLVILAFHQAGGPARLLSTLVTPAAGATSLTSIVALIVQSIAFAVAASAPLVIAAIIMSVAEALIARAATPAHISALLAPLRGVGLLAVAALVLDRIVEFLIAVGL